MSNELQGHVAVISGGLGDIGRAIGAELAERGAAVALSDVRDTAPPLPFKARYDKVDVTDHEAVKRWVLSVEQDLGTPTLVIVNAGVASFADIRTVTFEQWRRDLSVNLDGAFNLAQAGALRMLAASKPGRIVFIGSWVAYTPQKHIPAYCVSKAGLRMLCKTMALSLAEHHILCNEVAPGLVDAGLSAQRYRTEPGRRDNAMRHVPTHRLIDPREVALEVAHLCDPRNVHMTGTVSLIDGGLSLLSGPGQ